MLNKKFVVQKTLRLDQKLSEDLEILSKILERPQNELINIAIEKLLVENKLWFAHNILVDYCIEFIEGSKDTFELSLGKTNLSLSWDDETIVLNFNVLADGVVDTHKYKLADVDELIQKLRNLYLYLDLRKSEVEAYLKGRLNYK